MKSLMQNRGGIADLLKANVYGTGTASNVPVRQTAFTQ
jgi:hypothetical protein